MTKEEWFEFAIIIILMLGIMIVLSGCSTQKTEVYKFYDNGKIKEKTTTIKSGIIFSNNKHISILDN